MKIIRGISKFFTWLCMGFIVALMLLMVAEVLSRSIINRSILGGTEWAQVLLLCNMTALSSAILSNRQIKVDLVTSKLSPRAQVIIDTVVLTLAFATIAFLAWQQFSFSMKSLNNKVFYTTIGIPQWPFIVMFSFAYAVGALTTLSLVIRKIAAMVSGQWEKEAELEDMDEIFVFGRKKFAGLQATKKENASAASEGIEGENNES